MSMEITCKVCETKADVSETFDYYLCKCGNLIYRLEPTKPDPEITEERQLIQAELIQEGKLVNVDV